MYSTNENFNSSNSSLPQPVSPHVTWYATNWNNLSSTNHNMHSFMHTVQWRHWGVPPELSGPCHHLASADIPRWSKGESATLSQRFFCSAHKSTFSEEIMNETKMEELWMIPYMTNFIIKNHIKWWFEGVLSL